MTNTIDSFNADNFRIDRVEKAIVNGKSRIIFNAYERDTSGSYCHIGQFSAPPRTSKRGLLEIAARGGCAFFETFEERKAAAKIYTVNAAGIVQLRDFVFKHHKNFLDYACEDQPLSLFDRELMLGWKAEAEFGLSEGNGASIEIEGRYSTTGATVTFTIDEDGLDCEILEIDD